MLTKQIPVEDGGLKPRKHAIAYCSAGLLGLILSDAPQEVVYPDGNKGMAWTGIQMRHDTVPAIHSVAGEKTYTMCTGDRWSSRTPKVIGYLEDFDLMITPAFARTVVGEEQN